MHHILAAALAFAVIVPAVRADDKPKADAPAGATKTPAQQIAELEKEFEKEYQKIVAEFRTAAASAGVQVTDIGEVTGGKPGADMIGADGHTMAFQRTGFDHF